MDESVEQQKREAALTAELARRTRQVAGDEAASAAYLRQLEFQRAAEYIARIRRFYSGYSMADDLFTWSAEDAQLSLLADAAYTTPQLVICELRRIDDVRFVSALIPLRNHSPVVLCWHSLSTR